MHMALVVRLRRRFVYGVARADDDCAGIARELGGCIYIALLRACGCMDACKRGVDLWLSYVAFMVRSDCM